MLLRDYQVASRDRLLELFADGHRRATLVLPCGTGKTVVAAELIPTTRGAASVVFVPTIALLHQTWIAIARSHPGAHLLGVCASSASAADPDDMTVTTAAALLRTELTTDPDAIAEHLTNLSDPLVIVATYASSPAVAAAAAHSKTTFDLVVCDEAHRTAGRADKRWATPVHGVPAHRRLFMTATPRTITVSETTEPDLDTADVVSMSSLAEYGPHVAPIGFREAIAAGHLADYQIAVIGVSARHAWNTLAINATKTGHRAAHAASQLALLNAIHTHGLRSVLVFHNRIVDSQEWTKQLTKTAKALSIPLRAYHIDGSTDDAKRRTILGHLATPADRLTVVSNCRVFAEGIDVPELDAVMFAAPRTAGPDIVQIVGRAIRPHPQRRHQKALIILPVLDHGDDPADIDTKAARTSYLAAWQVLTALAEEDELLHASLVRWRDQLEGDGPPADNGDERIMVNSDALSATGAAFVLKTLARASSPHLVTANRLRTFHAHYGHTRVAPNTVIDGFRLSDRLNAARAAHRAGRMHPRIAAQFESIDGFAWNLRTSQRQRTAEEWIALVQHYITTTGVRTITRDAWVIDPNGKSRANIGRWVHDKTRSARYLTNDERKKLNATGYRLPA